MKIITPALFIGHGSPMNAIEKNNFTKSLISFGKKIKKPKAILVISAHWTTPGTFVTGSAKPEQIYDFYGFPKELYQIKYSALGNLRLAKKICEQFKNIHIKLNSEWGIDHGAWTVLKHLFPDADVPVIQLSLNFNKTEKEHMAIAKKLSALRQEGVMIIGSGNIVHNLALISWERDDGAAEWAKEFDKKIKEYLLADNKLALANYSDINEDLKERAVPTNEHYLPMLYIIALRQPGEKLSFIYEGFEHRSLSMRSFIIG